MRRRRKMTHATVTDGRVSYALTGDELQDNIDVVTCWPDVSPRNADVYAPQPNQRVPKAGAWGVIARHLPPMERELDQQLTPGRAFWLQHLANADDDGFSPDGRYKVLCPSPFGDVVLWPYEYVVVQPTWLVELWQAGEMIFHPIHTSERTFSDVLFYCLTRGLSRADATVMALGTLSGPVGWFEPHAGLRQDVEDFCEAFAHVGVLTEENRQRRAATRQRRGAKS